MALKKSEIYSTLWKCANKLRSNSGLGAEAFKNYVLIILFLKYMSDRAKTGKKSIFTIPEGCSFDDIVALKGTTKIGDKINKIIAKIAEENDLQDVINVTDHDFCDKKLGNLDESSKLITELVAAFQVDGLDFSQNRAADDDLIGDAYEFFMRNFASQAGKDKGQFYTPTEVSRLMALLIGIDQDNRKMVSVYDPTCGSGSLLLRVKAAAKPNVSIDGQDIDPANIELSYLNMFLHDCDTADIRVGDTLNLPQHTTNGILNTYDYIVSNPKFSLHNWMTLAKPNDTYGRWNSEIGVPPQQYGDYAFLLHCVKSLKATGKCAIILPNGVLTRGGDEARLRRWLVEQHLITGIIAFPANAFFGTSIAGNVIVLDNRRKSDGIFFIDASNLGYKDEDSKIRLREQDIKRVIDVWRERKDVPHFAYLATYKTTQQEGEDHPMYQVEREGFALNLSLYVTPEDDEVHQDIDAHLHGGIPENDVERLSKFWSVCSTLRAALFKSFRPGFVKLAVEQNIIPEIIEQNESFRAQTAVYRQSIEQWTEKTEPLMLAVGKDNDPKKHIAAWGQSILDMFTECQSLVDAYDVYDELLDYYNSTMQDDLYMISKDGWSTPLKEPTKKSPKYTDLQCDLLPVSLAVQHFHPDMKLQLDAKISELATIQEQMQNHLEEYEEDFQDNLFYGKFNAANLKKKIQRCMPMKSTKGKKNGKNKIVEYSTGEQRKHWQRYAELLAKEKEYKTEISKLDKQLYAALLKTYSELKPEVAKQIIVKEKWLAEIEKKVNRLMDVITHNITTEVKILAKRYERTLSQLQGDYQTKEKAVLNHLKAMGFEL